MKSRRFKVFIGMFYMLWRHVERCKLQHAKKKTNSQQDVAFRPQIHDKMLRSGRFSHRCCDYCVKDAFLQQKFL